MERETLCDILELNWLKILDKLPKHYKAIAYNQETINWLLNKN